MRYVLVLALVFVLAPTFAEAQAYRWVDDKGVVHFTDSFNDIPPQFRSSVTPLGLNPPRPPDPAPPKRWEVVDAQGRRHLFAERAACEAEAEKISQALNRTVFCQQREE